MGFIIVGLDGSETSRDAFHEAVKEAEWRNASLVALHVVSNPIMTGYEAASLLRMAQENGERLMADELELLEKEYPDGFPVAVEGRVTIGHAGGELLDAAQPGDGDRADLVVMGSRGLGGFRGLLVGSVTTYASHHLACPLLIVPHQES